MCHRLAGQRGRLCLGGKWRLRLSGKWRQGLGRAMRGKRRKNREHGLRRLLRRRGQWFGCRLDGLLRRRRQRLGEVLRRERGQRLGDRLGRLRLGAVPGVGGQLGGEQSLHGHGLHQHRLRLILHGLYGLGLHGLEHGLGGGGQRRRRSSSHWLVLWRLERLSRTRFKSGLGGGGKRWRRSGGRGLVQ